MCACFAVDTPALVVLLMPATRSSNFPATLLAALTLFCVNCGKATRMAMNITAAAAMISSATLRYVTVVHATWIPGLRLTEDTLGRKTY
jgi:hypothetical protein